MFTLTLTHLETRISEKKGDYTYAKAKLHKKDGSILENVTVMAFGQQHAKVKSILRMGRKIKVSAVWDNKVLKILGPARPRESAKAA